MKNLLERLLKIDRRALFVLTAAALFLPLVRPLNLPNKFPSADVRRVYDYIESLPEGSFMLLSLDIDPANRPELYPQAAALLRHAFRKNHRVAAVNFVPSASGIIEELFHEIPPEFSKQEGADYVILPFQPNLGAVLTQCGTDLYAIYDRDRSGNYIKEMPAMRGVRSFSDVALAVEITATDYLGTWVALASDRFGFKLAGGVTAVIQPGFGPYLQTGQLVGLMGGMKGAADYETLLGVRGKGSAGIDALNAGHFLVLGLMVFANAALLVVRFL